jgi:hypothetical protein
MRYLSIVVVLLLSISAARAVEVAPLSRQVMILTKVLSHSNKIVSETEDLQFGILGDRNDFVSKTLQKTMFESVKENEKARVGQRKIVPVMVDIRKLKTAEVHVIYITPGMKKHLKKIVEHSRDKKILTISGVAEHLDKGVSIGILPKGDAYQIVLNLTGADQEEVEFDAALHKLAKTMRSQH